MNIVLFGPPGAGKSTQAALLMQHGHFRSISTGQKLRETAASGSDLGKELAQVMEAGQLVDDALMLRLLDAWLAEIPATSGLLLDGFPRTVAQAKALDDLLSRHHRALDLVIALALSDTEAVRRLSGRRMCIVPGQRERIIHINDKGAVDECLTAGGKLVQRPDDAPEAIIQRLNTYNAQTEPLLHWYGERDLLHLIDADGSPKAINKAIMAAL